MAYGLFLGVSSTKSRKTWFCCCLALVILSPGRSLASAGLGACTLLPLWLLVICQALPRGARRLYTMCSRSTAACTLLPAAGSRGTALCKFCRKKCVLRRVPFQVGRHRKSDELESNFSRNSSTWILVHASSGLPLLGPQVGKLWSWLITGLYLWRPQWGGLLLPQQSPGLQRVSCPSGE